MSSRRSGFLAQSRRRMSRRMPSCPRLERLGIDHLGDAVGLAVGHAHHAGDVADHALGAEGAEGDDVGDAAFAVFSAHVVDDLAAAGLAEVDVDVGRADAFGIEESFEDQAEAERADVGDADGVGDQRAGGRAAARADRDAVVPGPLDEVRGDQEVGGEAELVDGIASRSRGGRSESGIAGPFLAVSAAPGPRWQTCGNIRRAVMPSGVPNCGYLSELVGVEFESRHCTVRRSPGWRRRRPGCRRTGRAFPRRS